MQKSMPFEQLYIVGILVGSLLFPALLGILSFFFNRQFRLSDKTIEELKDRDTALEKMIVDAREAATARDYLHDLSLQRINMTLSTLSNHFERFQKWMEKHE